MLDSLKTKIIKLGLRAFSFLPTSCFPIVSRIIGNTLYALLERERTIIYYQLKIAFPNYSEQELIKVSKGTFISLCLMILECLQSKKLISKVQHPNNLTKEETGYFKFKDNSGLNTVLQSNTGAICLVSHCANFELLAGFYIAKGVPLTAIAREPNFKSLIKIVEDFRSDYGLNFLWRQDKNNAKKLLKSFKTGRFLVALIDQDTNLESIYTKFFGLECAHPKGPISIAVRLNKPVFIVYDTRLSDGSHKIYINRIQWELLKEDRTKEELEQFIVDEYSKRLEAHIREYPSQWVWWHRRWRRIEGDDPFSPKKTDEYIEFLKNQIKLRES